MCMPNFEWEMSIKKRQLLAGQNISEGHNIGLENMRKREFPTTWNWHQINGFLFCSPISLLNESCQKCVSSTFSIAVHWVNPCTEWNRTCFGLQCVQPGWPETSNIFMFGMTKWWESTIRPTFETFFSFDQQFFNFQFATILVRFAWPNLSGKFYLKRTSLRGDIFNGHYIDF